MEVYMIPDIITFLSLVTFVVTPFAKALVQHGMLLNRFWMLSLLRTPELNN